MLVLYVPIFVLVPIWREHRTKVRFIIEIDKKTDWSKRKKANFYLLLSQKNIFFVAKYIDYGQKWHLLHKPNNRLWVQKMFQGRDSDEVLSHRAIWFRGYRTQNWEHNVFEQRIRQRQEGRTQDNLRHQVQTRHWRGIHCGNAERASVVHRQANDVLYGSWHFAARDSRRQQGKEEKIRGKKRLGLQHQQSNRRISPQLHNPRRREI